RFSRDWSSDVCSSDLTLKRYAQFEKECFTAAGELNEEREGCVEGMELWSQDFDRLEKFHNAIGEELDGIANSENTGKTPDCPTRSEERRVGQESDSRW